MKYLALGLAGHSETLACEVGYIPLYDNQNAKLWVRPMDMFAEEVVVNGQSMPRFAFISSR